MNKMTRMALTAGMALATTVSLGVGVAAASPQTTTSPQAITTQQGVQQTSTVLDEFEFYQWYKTYKSCRQAGKKGENRDEWYDFDCEEGDGRNEGKFALYVAYTEEDPDECDWDDEWCEDDDFEDILAAVR
ncbi:hypothetical protein [Actinoplanes sp. GCM10030250]|uniref:hypothetical protein n=1 Tax=Actinoplanes sp. GCM10030250 TaxID=3273376 RepID=UPI0036141A86